MTAVVGDRYAGEWPQEAFERHGIAYDSAGQTKAELYAAFLPLLTSARVELLDQHHLHVQLPRFAGCSRRGGRETIDNAPRRHDDVANAGTGAVVLALNSAGTDAVPRGVDEVLGLPARGARSWRDEFPIPSNWRGGDPPPTGHDRAGVTVCRHRIVCVRWMNGSELIKGGKCYPSRWSTSRGGPPEDLPGSDEILSGAGEERGGGPGPLGAEEQRKLVRILQGRPSPSSSSAESRTTEVKVESNGARPRERGRVSGLKTVGLFTGIGGLELGLKRAGHLPILFCESDPAAQKVLEIRFPGIEIAPDVRALRRLPAATELVAAGFPCTDLSQAGDLRGLEGKQSRLVNEILRLVEDRPVPWVLIENVPFMVWLSAGAAIRHVIGTFDRIGYRWAYRTVDSRAFGLPQRRERIFILASTVADPRAVLLADSTEPTTPHVNGTRLPIGFYWTEGNRGWGKAVDAVPPLKGGSAVGIPSPPAIWMPDGSFVTPDIRDAERLQGFPVDWTKPAETIGVRSVRWRLVGNAVTTKVAQWIGSRLGAPGSYDGERDRIAKVSAPLPRATWGDGTNMRVADVSTWPARREAIHLDEFLHFDPTPLSAGAASGFASRARKSNLRFPRGFLRALERHAALMRRRDAGDG